MVDINGKNYSDIVKIKGTDKKIDLTKLEGLQRTEKNKPIFDMVDQNKDGIIDTSEAKSLQGNLLTSSKGNGKLSEREANKHYGKGSNAFEAAKALADQQKAFEEGKEYIEQNGKTTTRIYNSNIGDEYSYRAETDEEGITTTYLNNGIQKIQYKDGSYQQIEDDGTVFCYDKDGNTTAIIQNGNTTTFPDDHTSITKNLDGEIIQTVITKDNQIIRTDFEYQDGKTIEREYSDVGDNAPLTGITVKEKKDGHNIDTKFATEEDMANNKPSEIVTDSHNPTQKTVTKFTYNEDGTYSTETTDSAGNKTVKKFNADGTEIVEKEKPAAPTTHTVIKGESITKIVTDALAQQGIENPTPEQLKEAKREFLELNKDLVKTYKGVRKEWHGNKFFYPDDVVKLPNFVKEEVQQPTEKTETSEVTNPKVIETPETETETTTTVVNTEEVVEETTTEKVTETPETETEETEVPEEIKVKQEELQARFGSNYKVEIAEDGTFVVKDKNGNVLPEATKMANGATDNDSEVNLMLAYDGDGSTTLDKNEYTNFIIDFMSEAGVQVDDSNREAILNLIESSFNSIDVSDKNGALTKAELKEHAEKVINDFADSVNEILE